MRGDDRLMTILTGVVLTVALGVVAQRSELIGFGDRAAPRDDVATLIPGRSYLIDVLANDGGLRAGDGERILITASPGCGAVNRRDGRLAYSAPADCRGTQRLAYCLPRGDACPAAQVTLVLAADAEVESSASGTPLARLETGTQTAGLAAVSAPPASSGFEAEPPATPERGPLSAITSAFGSLAPEEAEADAAQ